MKTTHKELMIVDSKESNINNTIKNIVLAKEAKKSINELISNSLHSLMTDINYLFIVEKNKPEYSNFNNKSIALLVLTNNSINHSEDTRLLLNVLSNGLTIHLSLKFSVIKYAFNQFLKGNISKSKFNDETKLLNEIISIKEAIKIQNAKQLINDIEVIDVNLITL